MATVKSPAEMQRLLASSRQTPRPTFYSVVTLAPQQISYEFETFLITMQNSDKRGLVNRLRKSMDQCDTGLDRDAMLIMAAKYEMMAVGAQSDEISIELGDYAGFSRTQLQGTQLPEISELVNSIGSAMGSKLFQRDQCENDVIALGTSRNDIEAGLGLANKKKQIQSWITIITSYCTTA